MLRVERGDDHTFTYESSSRKVRRFITIQRRVFQACLRFFRFASVDDGDHHYALSYVLSSAVLSLVEGNLVSYVYTKCFFTNGMWFSIADDAYERTATITAMIGMENRGLKVSVRR